MEVTRQLRTDRLNKLGLAPIMLTVRWAAYRLRQCSGQRCLPKHWDEKRQHATEKARHLFRPKRAEVTCSPNFYSKLSGSLT